MKVILRVFLLSLLIVFSIGNVIAADLIVEIQSVDGAGIPNGDVLASEAILPSTIPPPVPLSFRNLIFSAPAFIRAGDQFAIVLRTEGQCGLSPGPNGDTYLDGQGFFDSRPNPPGWVPLDLSGDPNYPNDLHFQTIIDGSVDQEQPTIELGYTLAIGSSSEQKLAQVVTAGKTGNLTEVRFAVACEAPPNQPPIADAGPNQVVSAGPDCMALVTLDGSGSLDPNDDTLTYTWTWDDGSGIQSTIGVNPNIELPIGNFTVTLLVDNGTVDSEPDTVDISVIDNTAPAITANLILQGEEDEERETDEGNFEVSFWATDNCDLAPSVDAVLIIEGWAEPISVFNGQVIEFEYENVGAEIEWEGPIMEIEAPAMTLQVTATDASGKTAMVKIMPQGISPDNDVNDDDEDNGYDDDDDDNRKWRKWRPWKDD